MGRAKDPEKYNNNNNNNERDKMNVDRSFGQAMTAVFLLPIVGVCIFFRPLSSSFHSIIQKG